MQVIRNEDPATEGGRLENCVVVCRRDTNPVRMELLHSWRRGLGASLRLTDREMWYPTTTRTASSGNGKVKPIT